MPEPSSFESTSFERAVDFVLAQEGGWTVDTGGATRYGISIQTYPDEDIANLTQGRAKEIYRRDYWDALGLDELPNPVAVAMLDVAVNLGRKSAVKRLQRAVNLILGQTHLKVDGLLGPKTKGAVLDLASEPWQATILGMLVAIGRLDIHYRLAAGSKYAPYIRGWAGRCVRLCKQLVLDQTETNKEK